jgi:CBS-domain-containing membrane protein
MTTGKTIREILIPLTDYPHMPYWFSVRQAVTMLQLAAGVPGAAPPRMVLVFDEKYQLLGTLGQAEILRGLEPRFLSGATRVEGPVASTEELALLWSDAEACRQASEREVREVMRPVQSTVAIDDPVTRAAVALLADGAAVVAVMEGRKVAGVVRLEDVYDVITAAMAG